jgi:hypothetical protein
MAPADAEDPIAAAAVVSVAQAGAESARRLQRGCVRVTRGRAPRRSSKHWIFSTEGRPRKGRARDHAPHQRSGTRATVGLSGPAKQQSGERPLLPPAVISARTGAVPEAGWCRVRRCCSRRGILVERADPARPCRHGPSAKAIQTQPAAGKSRRLLQILTSQFAY